MDGHYFKGTVQRDMYACDRKKHKLKIMVGKSLCMKVHILYFQSKKIKQLNLVIIVFVTNLSFSLLKEVSCSLCVVFRERENVLYEDLLY